MTTIAQSSTLFYGFGGATSINDTGTVAFRGIYNAGGDGIFTGDGGPLTTVAAWPGQLGDFWEASINNGGTVAFKSGVAGGYGIFTGPDPSTETVVRTGQPLLGSTISDLRVYSRGLNDAGQVAFWAELADGTKVIARADPVPEPASCLLLLTGISLLLPGGPRA